MNDRAPGQLPDRERLGVPALVFAAVLIVVLLALFRETRPPNQPAVAPRTVAARGDLAADEQSTISLFQAAVPSVAYVSRGQLFRNRHDFNLTEVPAGTGSGFVWDDQGHVITNYHVVLDADVLRVTLSDGSQWKASPIGGSADYDIAVLQIPAPPSEVRPIPIGTSADLRVGQKVFAIGNPFGWDFSLTTGVVSALNREILSVSGRRIEGVIQTDAAINPGNSGGPLLDSAGRLIGMNTAIYSPSGSSAGIGFAVPVDTINRIVPELIAHGKVMRPGLGVLITPDEMIRQYSLPGVGIRSVSRGSAAEQAGLKAGDVIIRIDDQQTPTGSELLSALGRHTVGDQVAVVVLREDQQLTLVVTLQAVD